MEIDNESSCLTVAMPAADRTAAFCDVLQLLGTAAVLVDSDGRVVGLNDALLKSIGFSVRNLPVRFPGASRRNSTVTASGTPPFRRQCVALWKRLSWSHLSFVISPLRQERAGARF